MGFEERFLSNSVYYGTFGQVNSNDLLEMMEVNIRLSFFRIHGINWSHKQETHLTTASQDGTVKYFCINSPRRAEKIITTSSPVWRARYTVVSVIIFSHIKALEMFRKKN